MALSLLSLTFLLALAFVTGVQAGIRLEIGGGFVFRLGHCLPASGIGYFIRILLVSNQNSLGDYVGMQLLIVCSPAAFLAFNYIVYGRFIINCVGRQYSLIRPEIVARIFVISDITTFLVQSGGGSIGIVNNIKVQNAGSAIFLGGLVAQTFSYVIFLGLLTHAHRKIVKSGEYSKNEIWWTAVKSYAQIRCIYRVTELAQGHGGYLLIHESTQVSASTITQFTNNTPVYFYFLDSLPLVIAISTYIPLWPGNYIKTKSTVAPSEYQLSEDVGNVEASETPGVEVIPLESRSYQSETKARGDENASRTRLLKPPYSLPHKSNARFLGTSSTWRISSDVAHLVCFLEAVLITGELHDTKVIKVPERRWEGSFGDDLEVEDAVKLCERNHMP
ncbi:hypothetical protein JAAARDRAFT_76148 [Jaapia argillacea MUCL 33604]|uniref:RTA1 like protein n=1 Tax=Jaapia argillacea MUCL 33604 TaxID=933084 RepID=A0A067Q5A0_9AGAM|nr:hypothetical protein JAAARDRAFT_76148 [Jaapia argillacea MUCL 33604]